MQYHGREITAKKEGNFLQIDVLQKEGDCPKGYSKEERMNCPKDCQNTYLTFMYHKFTGTIPFEGALVTRGMAVEMKGIIKHDLDISLLEAMIRNSSPDIETRDKGDIIEVYYKGDFVAKAAECEFTVADKIYSVVQEQQDYQAMIRSEPKKVLEQCGIKVIDGSDPNDLKELKDRFKL